MQAQAGRANFAACLDLCGRLVFKRLDIWCGYLLLSAFILALGRWSLCLGIVFSICCFFSAVNIAAYVDNIKSAQMSGLMNTLKASLPLSLSLATLLMLCWFVFRLVYNLYTGDYDKIAQFFYNWTVDLAVVSEKSAGQMASWFYASSIVSLLFVLLMFYSYASWFSYPLMAFEQLHWVQAKQTGLQLTRMHKKEMRKLTLFVLVLLIAGLGLLPILTPVVYMLLAILMYASYLNFYTCDTHSGAGNIDKSI